MNAIATADAAPPRTVATSWNADDVVRYHLALGAGGSASDPELRYVDEEQVRALPTFAVVAAGVASTPLVYGEPLCVDPDRVLHVAQSVELHRPLPANAADARQVARVESVWERGSAATVVVRVDTSDGEQPLCTSRFTLLVRDAGGFGGEPEARVSLEVPTADPDAVVVVPTLRQQALLYRACADAHRIHLDPAVARAAGFDGPILQGLCTWGIACKALVDELLDGDASTITTFDARFAGPVHPGETLRISAWLEDGGCRFVCDVVERDAPALRAGRMEVHPSGHPLRRKTTGG